MARENPQIVLGYYQRAAAAEEAKLLAETNQVNRYAIKRRLAGYKGRVGFWQRAIATAAQARQ